MALFLGSVGLSPIALTPRFTFRLPALVDGINIAPLALGLFGFRNCFSLP